MKQINNSSPVDKPSIEDKVREFAKKFEAQRDEQLDLVVELLDEMRLHVEELNDKLYSQQKSTYNLLSLIRDADTLDEVVRIIDDNEVDTLRTNITNPT